MRYRVELQPRAQRQLQRLRRQVIYRRLLRALVSLESDPRPSDAKQLSTEPGWRIRVGDYRIVYEFEDVVRIVTVTRIGHRRNVYRELDLPLQ